MIANRTRRLLIALFLVLSGCRADKRNSADVLKAFADEFYSGQAQADITPIVSRYTDWPDFVVGSTVQIATSRDIRLVLENGDEAEFEIRFKVAGEETLGKVEPEEMDVVQTFRMRRRRGQWRILEPINIPCISVAGELTRLKALGEDAARRIASDDFTRIKTREYFESVISNAHASITLLEGYH